MASFTVDFFSSLDGNGSARGWPGYWGKEGPELREDRVRTFAQDQVLVFMRDAVGVAVARQGERTGLVETVVVVERGDELGEGYRRRITEVYVRSFAEDFVAFSRDTGKLADAFEHMLLLERFYVALVDREPAGLASLTEGDQTLLAPRWPEIRRHLGPVRGLLAYVVIRRWFMHPSDGAQPGRGEIGFVATEPAYQGRGVATALLRHLLALPGYREYVLEDIKDTNAPALGLYAKLGFTVYKRRKMRFARRVGFTELLSMKFERGSTA
jgi:ribosomal protein S18 acetylase RimI-like enzyme